MTRPELARSILALLASVATALAGVFLAVDSWQALATPHGVGGLLVAAGSGVWAWMGEKPKMPRGGM